MNEIVRTVIIKGTASSSPKSEAVFEPVHVTSIVEYQEKVLELRKNHSDAWLFFYALIERKEYFLATEYDVQCFLKGKSLP